MLKANVINNVNFKKGDISPALYGSFVEHMGRVVYSGIYEPGHPQADANGFRRDVLEKVKDMGITCIRYPGGNFVSNYDWRDGVGPKEERPRKRELAWKSIETNQFGTDEFMQWIAKAGAEPIFATNLGTAGVENAVSLLEYCNMPGGTFYSDKRVENGRKLPHGIKKWCLGNEMDGIWQLGHKDAEDYGKLAAQTAHAMKSLDETVELVVCGSSSTSMATYTDWERTVLEYTYEFVDYIALHQYYGGQERGTAEFLAQSLDLEQYIKTVIGICDTVKSKKRGKKDIQISIDEWGVWEIPGTEVADSVKDRDWEVAPAFSEQIYTMEDSLLFASMLMAMVKNCDRVKIACQSLLTNISAAIMTERGGDSWVQPIYYPFSYMAKYARGTVLETVADIPTYQSRTYGEVPVLDVLAVYEKTKGELVYFIVNRTEEKVEFSMKIEDVAVKEVTEWVTLQHEDIKATNQKKHDNVVPKNQNIKAGAGVNSHYMIDPYSWNMIRFRVK